MSCRRLHISGAYFRFQANKKSFIAELALSPKPKAPLLRYAPASVLGLISRNLISEIKATFIIIRSIWRFYYQVALPGKPGYRRIIQFESLLVSTHVSNRRVLEM